jgi:hypothetical protein
LAVLGAHEVCEKADECSSRRKQKLSKWETRNMVAFAAFLERRVVR